MNAEQRITKFIKKSAFHAVFVSEAIDYYVAELLKNEEQAKKDLTSSGIDPETWFSIAKESKENK